MMEYAKVPSRKPMVYLLEESLFKKSTDSSFVQRQRFNLSNYHVPSSSSISVTKYFDNEFQQYYSAIVINLSSTDESNSTHQLKAYLIFYESDILRLIINDEHEQKRYKCHDILDPSFKTMKSYDLSSIQSVLDLQHSDSVLFDLPIPAMKCHIQFQPFALDVINAQTNNVVMSINKRSSLKYDRFEPIDKEVFNGFVDSMKRGCESIGIDIEFPTAQHLHGIPERTIQFSLPNTIDKNSNVLSEPYRMYNIDMPFFDIDKPIGLYGSIPFMYARPQDSSDNVAMFWHNTSETYVDIIEQPEGNSKSTHWYSETGIVDIFFMLSPSLNGIYQKYLLLTGAPVDQPRSAISYNQCRYSYMSQKDVLEVNKGFEEHKIPMDIIWLDIDHTNGKRYFTWNYETFPNPTQMINELVSKGRKVVTIVDPHVYVEDNKYELHVKAIQKQLYILNKDEKTNYIGKCWPGLSAYFNYYYEPAQKEWSDQFDEKHFKHFQGNKGKMHIWNDMNENSVFDGPERTLPKDVVHRSKDGTGMIEHRHIHNISGHLMIKSTYMGLKNNQRLEEGNSSRYRPFVLTRSFFAGSQRYAAAWTGDNTADFQHLQSSIRMLLTISMCGLSLIGADVGGFFGDPDYELTIRWYQTGAFQPFFRGHSMTDTKRREPWVFGPKYTPFIRHAIQARYSFLPYWITAFAMNSGISNHHHLISPVMRPVCWEFPSFSPSPPQDEKSWMIGNALLVAPILHPISQLQNMHLVNLPAASKWYDLFHLSSPGIGVEHLPQSRTVAAQYEVKYNGSDVTDFNRMFVYQRAGTIVPKVPSVNVQSHSQWPAENQPLILVIALDENNCAQGHVYVDDGETFACKDRQDFILCDIRVGNGFITSKKLGGDPQKVSAYVTKFIILGVDQEHGRDIRVEDLPATFDYSKESRRLTISDICLKLDGDWRIPYSNKLV